MLASILPAIAQRGPAPTATGLTPALLSQACAPSLAYERPEVPLRITGGQDSVVRTAYAPGDLVTINAGAHQGMTVGQEFYTRRALIRGRASTGTPITIRTTGWIRVYAVDEEMSLATITHACDSVDVDDYLEPFALPTVPAISKATGKPERGNYGRVLVGQDSRTAFGTGDYLVVDRGANHGVTPGARFVIYHDKQTPGNFLFEIGEAVAVDVKPDSSTVRVITALDGILEGDYVGMRK
jgi:hypothetical protein